MNRKSSYSILLAFVLIFTYLISTCDENSVSKPDLTQDQLDSLTLASLKKVDDYPLYVMTYYGDYGFDDYLKTGSRGGRPSNILLNINNDHWACTCFTALAKNGNKILGRNFDYPRNPALILFTDPPDGYASVSIVDLGFFGYSPSHLPASPDNRQNLLRTPYLPFDGMNEQGVVIGMMAISHAESPYNPAKVTIGEIEVIRLVLDYAKNVDQAINLINQYNVRIDTPPIHYLIADKSGKSIIIEFLNREMIVIENREPWQVSTNFIIHGSGAPDNVSCWRYKKAYQTLKAADGNITQQDAIQILESVSQSSTIWSAVYEMKTGEIDVSVGRNYDSIKHFRLSPLKLSFGIF